MSSMDELVRSLGRIEGKLDGIDQRLESHGDRAEGIEKRIAAVEKKVWYGTGIAAGIGFLIAQFKGVFH